MKAFGTFVLIFTMVAVFFYCTCRMIGYDRTYHGMAEFNATRAAFNNRDSFTDSERTALMQTVVQQNAWLSRIQYTNTTWTRWTVPNAVDDLKPIGE